eukprot:gnl/TRDRNA2_/TRDRNA2_156974_c0_seq1.p1 gnl/TRDRNA2_/TRDRNA2_156974_c0~~gnl/TRDRNA2_/TRDRNA2_156974_c0_seq1.p1  ORF type:complete len:392 (+),score=35.99 gnl/TRDRNA2_/TRDRNA2_156974_c0_seq1:130-1305(+)
MVLFHNKMCRILLAICLSGLLYPLYLFFFNRPEWEAVLLGGLTRTMAEARWRQQKCATLCWENAVSIGLGQTCKTMPEACSSCVFCQWPMRKKHMCPQTAQRRKKLMGQKASTEESPKVCQAANVSIPSESLPTDMERKNVTGCLRDLGLTPDAKQQLKGVVLDSICQQMRLLRRARGSSGQTNMLVFSVGYDSPLWMSMNAHGSTQFIEDDAQWVDMQPDPVKQATSIIKYETSMPEADTILCNYKRLGALVPQLPPKVLNTCWDLIVVDGPLGVGYNEERKSWDHGRMASIYAASQLAGDHTAIFVDDCDRRVESLYTLWHMSAKRDLHILPNGHQGYTCMVYTARPPSYADIIQNVQNIGSNLRRSVRSRVNPLMKAVNRSRNRKKGT